MREITKKQLYETLKTMHEAHEDISRRLKKGNTTGIVEALGECQGLAIQIGELIDSLEGEGTKTVLMLEKYCEMVYQISQDLNGMACDKTFKMLKEYLEKIEDSICNDLPTKYEVVFFPYKAAMWDSLESIWKAADADPNVDAYVVPIPYYDMNSDRTFGQMHYEGDQYPTDVPVYSWEQYHMKERRPDAIFIHNPYDGSNYVTSVHPDFFASKLKKYTDMLVYVPYFVSLDDVEKHFCVVPATMYADKVIIQSEKIKETYIRVFEEWVKENKCEKIFPDFKEKFLALGSPKFDKVISTRRENCIIPEEWKRQMHSEDGGTRKIILYNTTIATLLIGNEKVLNKIEDTLEIFKNNQKVLLLWRPHPLNATTCAAMRPNLLKRYEHIVEKYKSEGWGIYDDTPDMNRAIALSDAYYGDWSSMVALYKVTGKPIMIQNILN